MMKLYRDVWVSPWAEEMHDMVGFVQENRFPSFLSSFFFFFSFSLRPGNPSGDFLRNSWAMMMILSSLDDLAAQFFDSNNLRFFLFHIKSSSVIVRSSYIVF